MVSSVAMAQECPLPAVTVLKLPVGASACPLLFSPQHVMVSLVAMAQECLPPAVTVLKLPVGASACPLLFSPQHVMVSSVPPRATRPPAPRPPARRPRRPRAAPAGRALALRRTNPVRGCLGSWQLLTSHRSSEPVAVRSCAGRSQIQQRGIVAPPMEPSRKRGERGGGQGPGRPQGRVPNSGRSVLVRLSSQKPATFIMATRASHMATESSLGGTRVMTGPK